MTDDEKETAWQEAKKAAADALERAYWLRLWKKHDGNVSAISRTSGVERSQVRYYLRRLGIDLSGRKTPRAPKPAPKPAGTAPTKFGAAMKAAMRARRITGASLAHDLSVSAATVTNWATGRTLPSPEAYETLCRVLGATLPRPEHRPKTELGRALRDARAKLGLTLETVAERSGIAVSAIGQYEAGRRAPTPETQRKLRAALELDDAQKGAET